MKALIILLLLSGVARAEEDCRKHYDLGIDDNIVFLSRANAYSHYAKYDTCRQANALESIAESLKKMVGRKDE